MCAIPTEYNAELGMVESGIIVWIFKALIIAEKNSLTPGNLVPPQPTPSPDIHLLAIINVKAIPIEYNTELGTVESL